MWPMEEEEGNPDVASVDNGDQPESRLAEFCKNKLALDEKSCKEAMNLFGETKHLLLSNVSSMGNGTSEEAERYWFAFILYSLKRLIQKDEEIGKEETEYGGLTLCRILRAAKLNIADFLKELPQFVVQADPILNNIYGTDWENRLEVLTKQRIIIPFLPGLCSQMAATHVNTAMTSAEWLHTVISPLASKPSQKLERFFTSCDWYVTSEAVRRAQIILQAIFPSSPRCVIGSLQCANMGVCYRVLEEMCSAEAAEAAEQQRLEALKLYYRVLEVMCSAEAQILHATNLASLLTNERFHRCMLACSAELVRATDKNLTMLFPAVLERTGITAFDFSMAIENFLRHEESLPRELRQHLNSLEERLLESMVWEKGSTMYNSLAVARPALSAEINHLGPLAEPNPGGGGETFAETGINIVFGKIMKLGAARISRMVESLHLSQQIMENVYCLFQQILNQRTSLFFNRHIDQIMLCCFYGVAKISKLNLTLREMIYNYRKQPQCKPRVFSSVFVDWSLTHRNGRTGQEHVHIITFYNEIFIPSVKPLLVELGPLASHFSVVQVADAIAGRLRLE